jgi:outer membrane protein insertion porin family
MSTDNSEITSSSDDRDNLLSLGFYLGYDTRDYWTNPRRGWWNEFEISRIGGFLGGDGDFWSFTFDLRRFHPLADRHIVSVFSLTTLNTGRVGEGIPVYRDFHLGGSNTIRGWSLDSTRGKNQFINTFEYRYNLLEPRPLSIRGMNLYFGVGLAAFTDVGIAWDSAEQFAANNFLDGYGLGLRFFVPFVDVIRFDFAWGEPDEGLRRHFGVPWKAVKQRQRIR